MKLFKQYRDKCFNKANICFLKKNTWDVAYDVITPYFVYMNFNLQWKKYSSNTFRRIINKHFRAVLICAGR